ncbi:helix-turn-helix domain-containing protein [Ruminococcus sp.]|uniref:helix-turn-helix domain-containing protein n=1 Tax=Ruminococcus sp. TaxID=41978 RepID=UPI002E815771|nr:helix-turn-helix transcriptional regulator [Ruminococcus sp.]MEE3439955.1 helix-turn-helix transcriptional regulator [Ruminococcus sp.]
MSKDEKMSRALAIAENIQLILDNSGFSEEEIADKLQIDHTLLKKWALAEETPTKEELEHIVSTFGLYKTYFKNNSEKNNSEVLWIKKKYMFAKQLRKALKSKKITIERFSKELGVLPSSVNKWLTGTYMPSEEYYDKIYNILGISVYDLLKDESVSLNSNEQKTYNQIIEILKPLKSVKQEEILIALRCFVDTFKEA